MKKVKKDYRAEFAYTSKLEDACQVYYLEVLNEFILTNMPSKRKVQKFIFYVEDLKTGNVLGKEHEVMGINLGAL